MHKEMKISILYKFRNTAWGGANQFLRALRNYFYKKECYADDPQSADVIIFISYPFNSEYLFREVKNLKKKKNIIVINRMNGPISLYRGTDRGVDRMNFMFDHDAADGTVFQSEWSRMKCQKSGMKQNSWETVIGNAPDPKIFYPCNSAEVRQSSDKVRILASSWSSNMNKGFDVYGYLDDNLDFGKYEMTFIGNSPIAFRNIRHISTLAPEKLAEKLRAHDIFVFASKQESCSNSLLEALHCGLPVVARRNSSQIETVEAAGILFESTLDVLAAIDVVAGDVEYYRSAINVQTIENVGKAYYDFCKHIYDDTIAGKYLPKKWANQKYLMLRTLSFKRKIALCLKNRIKRSYV